MFKTISLLKSILPVKSYVHYVRNLNTEIRRTVNPHSKILINCPFSVHINPLDYSKNFTNDQISIKLVSDISQESQAQVRCVVDKSKITITGKADTSDPNNKHVQCFIEAPIQSDIIAQLSDQANISVKQFSNGNITIHSEGGQIHFEDVKSTRIVVNSLGGDIRCKGLLLAQTFEVKNINSGNFVANRLQGNEIKVTVDAGTIQTESCYCDQAFFESKIGSLLLKNVHKNCIVKGTDLEKCIITGFDGDLLVDIESCKVIRLQLSQIHRTVGVKVKEIFEQPLNLQISEQIKDACKFMVNAGEVVLADNLQNITISQIEEKKLLSQQTMTPEMEIFCPNSRVHFELTSWADAFFTKNRFAGS